jgi:transcription antitermination factor NusG
VHPIRSTRGVAGLVRFGDGYRPVPRDVVNRLQVRADAAGMHRQHLPRPDGRGAETRGRARPTRPASS